jgi:hypothetical protein
MIRENDSVACIRRNLLLGFFLGDRIVRLAALHVTAFLDQIADLVGRDGKLALGANVESRCDQKIVTPSHALR